MAERRPAEQKSAAMRIKLKYPDVDTFVRKYGPNLSADAVFIATKSLKPLGTPLRFEFVLVSEAGETAIFRGEGTVAEVREAEQATATKPQGISVKFTRLFGDGQALVDRVVQSRKKAPKAQRETTGEVELANPRDIASGEFAALTPPTPELPAPEAEAVPSPPERVPAPVEPSRTPSERNEPVGPHVDVDALAQEWQISTDRVDEILRRRRPRDPALQAELESLLSAPPPPSVSPAEATARLAQLLDRRRGPR